MDIMQEFFKQTSTMERETISKNHVSSQKTTGVRVNFFRKEELLWAHRQFQDFVPITSWHKTDVTCRNVPLRQVQEITNASRAVILKPAETSRQKWTEQIIETNKKKGEKLWIKRCNVSTESHKKRTKTL
jgi:hypothetical protein